MRAAPGLGRLSPGWPIATRSPNGRSTSASCSSNVAWAKGINTDVENTNPRVEESLRKARKYNTSGLESATILSASAFAAYSDPRQKRKAPEQFMRTPKSPKKTLVSTCSQCCDTAHI